MYWQTLYTSADLQAVVPFGRWDMDRAYAPDMGGDTMRFYARFAAFCTDIEHFDAAAFRLSGQEAVAMDPQVRILMEATAASCTSAGILDDASLIGGQRSVGGLVGVFVGCMYHEHLEVVTSTTPKLSPQVIVGNGAPYMVGRLSYTFGFSGKHQTNC